MANTDTPFGLRPIRHKSGAAYNGAVNVYMVPASYATALFIGDPVVKTGTADATGKYPQVNKAAAGTTNRITGVIVGFGAMPDNLGLTYNPASTERLVMVCDDPDVIFEVQADGVVTAAQVGLNAVLVYDNTGDTTSGRSGAELSIGTAPAATAGFQLNILRLVNREDNELGEFAKLEVRINNHTEVPTSAGV